MSPLITLIVILVILAIVFYLVDKYIVPAIPAPWGRVIEGVAALIVIIFLLNKYLGLGL